MKRKEEANQRTDERQPFGIRRVRGSDRDERPSKGIEQARPAQLGTRPPAPVYLVSTSRTFTHQPGSLFVCFYSWVWRVAGERRWNRGCFCFGFPISDSWFLVSGFWLCRIYAQKMGDSSLEEGWMSFGLLYHILSNFFIKKKIQKHTLTGRRPRPADPFSRLGLSYGCFCCR